MSTLAALALAFLAVTLLRAIASGQGGRWLRAKFLGAG